MPELPDDFLKTSLFQLQRDKPLRSLSSEWLNRTVGDYRLVEELGAGTHGVVFRAKRESFYDKDVAIKMLFPRNGKPVSLKRFQAECQALATLNHPGIVSIQTAGIIDDQIPWLVMNYVDGSPLHEVGDRWRATTQDRQIWSRRVVGVMKQLCAAVEYAHDEGIVHCDLKPDNVLVTDDGRAHLTDLGLSVPLEDIQDLGSRSSWSPGTIGYMAPEILVSRKNISQLADIYSLGAILCRLLTGKRPYGNVGVLDGLLLTDTEESDGLNELLADVDPRLADICRRCLERDPTRRFPTAADLEAAFDDYLTQPATAVVASPAAKTSDRSGGHASVPRRIRMLAAVIACGLVAGGIVLTIRNANATYTQAVESYRQVAGDVIVAADAGPQEPGDIERRYGQLLNLVEQGEGLLDRYPDDAGLMRILAIVEKTLCRNLQYQRRIPEARQYAERSVDRFRSLVQQHPDDADQQFALFHSLRALARYAPTKEDDLEIKEEAFQHIDSLAENNRDNLDYADALADTLNQMAITKLEIIDETASAAGQATSTDDIEGYLERAYEVALRTARRPDHEPLHRKQLVVAAQVRFELAERQFDFDNAVEWCDRWVNEAELWAAEFDHPHGLATVCSALSARANLAWEYGDQQELQAACELARPIIQKLIDTTDWPDAESYLVRLEVYEQLLECMQADPQP